jgi:molecular chaperone DnaJ
MKGLGHASDAFQSLAGDLLLNVKVKEHPIFHKQGLNITSERPISIIEAILGTKITVETLDGNMNI